MRDREYDQHRLQELVLLVPNTEYCLKQITTFLESLKNVILLTLFRLTSGLPKIVWRGGWSHGDPPLPRLFLYCDKNL